MTLHQPLAAGGRIDLDAALASPVGQVHDGALDRHPQGQRLHLRRVAVDQAADRVDPDLGVLVLCELWLWVFLMWANLL